MPAVLLLSTRGLERRGREAAGAYARSGGGMLIAAGADVDGDVVADVLGAGSTLQRRHRDRARSRSRARWRRPTCGIPCFSAFARERGDARAGDVSERGADRRHRAARRWRASRPATTALIECPAGDGRALVLASDLDNRWNDFPLHATFVPFLHEVVRYLASARAHAVGLSRRRRAGGRRSERRASSRSTDAGASRPAAPRAIAVNVDPREADPARMSADEFQSAVTRLKDAGGVEARVEARQQEDQPASLAVRAGADGA